MIVYEAAGTGMAALRPKRLILAWSAATINISAYTWCAFTLRILIRVELISERDGFKKLSYLKLHMLPAAQPCLRGHWIGWFYEGWHRRHECLPLFNDDFQDITLLSRGISPEIILSAFRSVAMAIRRHGKPGSLYANKVRVYTPWLFI